MEPLPFRGRELRERAHPNCVACSPAHATGLKLEFSEAADGSVHCGFDCPESFTGYPGFLHGGIISTILDSAMTNAMFARGYEAVTAELAIKFRRPVLIGRSVQVDAKITKDLHPLYYLEASLSQDATVKASATAKFIIR